MMLAEKWRLCLRFGGHCCVCETALYGDKYTAAALLLLTLTTLFGLARRRRVWICKKSLKKREIKKHLFKIVPFLDNDK